MLPQIAGLDWTHPTQVTQRYLFSSFTASRMAPITSGWVISHLTAFHNSFFIDPPECGRFEKFARRH
jgi:hypothetical protein